MFPSPRRRWTSRTTKLRRQRQHCSTVFHRFAWRYHCRYQPQRSLWDGLTVCSSHRNRREALVRIEIIKQRARLGKKARSALDFQNTYM